MKTPVLFSLLFLVLSGFMFGQDSEYPFTIELIQGDQRCTPGEVCNLQRDVNFQLQLSTNDMSTGITYGCKKVNILISNSMNTSQPIALDMEFDPATGISSGEFSVATSMHTKSVTFVFDDIFKTKGKKKKKVSAPLQYRAIKVVTAE